MEYGGDGGSAKSILLQAIVCDESTQSVFRKENSNSSCSCCSNLGSIVRNIDGLVGKGKKDEAEIAGKLKNVVSQWAFLLCAQRYLCLKSAGHSLVVSRPFNSIFSRTQKSSENVLIY